MLHQLFSKFARATAAREKSRRKERLRRAKRRLTMEALDRRELLSVTVLSAGFETDDHGNDVAHATAVNVPTSGTAQVPGQIERAGDVDMFRFVAPSTGRMTIRQTQTSGSRLDSYLYVYDGTGNLLAQNDDSDGLNSRVEFDVVAGRTFFAKAAAYGSSTGSYQVTLAGQSVIPPADDHGNDMAHATAVNVPTSGTAQVPGQIERAGDVDMFRFVAPGTGRMTIRQVAAAGSGLDSYLYVYDASGNLLAQNDDSDGVNSLVTLEVTAGATYYVKAAGYGSSTGGYQVTFAGQFVIPPADDHGNDMAHATPVNVPTSGQVPGQIERAGDVDMFRFVAPGTGRMTIRQVAAAGSGLDSYLYVYDASGNLLAQNDDSDGVNSLVTLEVTAGATYYVKAAGYGSSTGGYQVTFAGQFVNGPADDHGNDMAHATPVNVPTSGTAQVPGQIERTGDVDVFRFVAPGTGRMTIRQVAAAGSGLDSYLYVYDASGNLLAQNDDSDGVNSLVTLEVTAGATYYVKAAGYGSSTGGYQVTLAGRPPADDHGNDMAHATPVNVPTSGTAQVPGQIERAGDVDMFRFVAPGTGRMTIRQVAAAGSGLDSYLYVYDASGNLLAQNDDSDGLNSRVELDVVAGATYYVKAAAYGRSTGGYQVTLTGQFVIDPPDGVVEYFALLVGSGQTDQERTYVQNDVAAVERDLTANGGNWDADNIRTVICDEVSEAAIDRLFETLGSEMDGDDVLFFYYTGHGSESGLALCSGEVLSPDELANAIRDALPDGAAFVSILDACHSGVFVDEFEARGTDNAYILSACDSTQTVPWNSQDGSTPWGRSMFTYYVTDSLDADGDRNHDGVVTLQEVYAFVDPRTISGSGHRADPQYYSAGRNMDNFPLVRGMPIVIEPWLA